MQHTPKYTSMAGGKNQQCACKSVHTSRKHPHGNTKHRHWKGQARGHRSRPILAQSLCQSPAPKGCALLCTWSKATAAGKSVCPYRTTPSQQVRISSRYFCNALFQTFHLPCTCHEWGCVAVPWAVDGYVLLCIRVTAHDAHGRTIHGTHNFHRFCMVCAT
jgi:hypothetical protein